MVYRVFVEKKKELAHEANNLKEDIRSLLRIDALEDLRIVNRYDVENIEPELFDYAVKTCSAMPAPPCFPSRSSTMSRMN